MPSQLRDSTLADPPQTTKELLAMVQKPGFLPANAVPVVVSTIKALGDAAGNLPIPWLSKCIIKILAALPRLGQEMVKAMQDQGESPSDFGFTMLKAILKAAERRKPLMLIIENVESVSIMSIDRAINEIVDLVRLGLPVLLLVSFDEKKISEDAKLLLSKRVEVGDAILWELPDASREDMQSITGPVSAQVLGELYELADGNVLIFEELWEESCNAKLGYHAATGEWVWDADAETEHFAKFTDGAFGALNRTVQRCVAEVGDEKRARLTLGAAALQGNTFCDEVVANVLWRVGVRLSDQYANDDGHVDQVIDMFDNQLKEVVSEAGFHGSKALHQFHSVLFRHYVKGDIPAEHKGKLCEYTASVLEQVYADRLSEYAWLIIELYEQGGQTQKARSLLDRFTSPPSPDVQAWELAKLSERIRALRSDTAWASWVIDVCRRLEYVPSVREKLLQVMDDAFTAMLTLGESEIACRVLLVKAGLFLDWGQYRQAHDTAQEVFTIMGNNSDAMLFAPSFNLQGGALHHLGHHREAEPLIRRALAISEQAFGPHDPGVASCLNNLAQLLKITNRLSEAEPLMRRALAIDEQAYGPDHPEVVVHLNNLAGLLADMHRLAEAEPLMRRALAIGEQGFGPNHPKVAGVLNSLAMLLAHMHRLAEAEPLMRRALAIDEQTLSPNHPSVAVHLNNLARCMQAVGRLSEAEPLMRRHVAILRKFGESTGHEHPYMQAAIKNYEDLLQAMGLPEEEIQRRVKEAAGL